MEINIKDPISNIISTSGKAIEKVGKAVDDNFESSEERQKELSARHAIDMASDKWLPQNIRPITLIYLLLAQSVIFILLFLEKKVPDSVIAQVGILLFGAFGFYFNSRKQEKLMDKKVDAAIKIEALKAKQEDLKFKQELKAVRKDARADRKAKRRGRRRRRHMIWWKSLTVEEIGVLLEEYGIELPLEEFEIEQLFIQSGAKDRKDHIK